MKLSQVQKEVLHSLLDKHENRRDYGAEHKSSRRTLLKVDSRRYPDYYHVSDSSFRLMFNAEMQQLEQQGWVNLEWEPFNEGEFLQRLVLRADALEEIYEVLERTPKNELYHATALMLDDWRQKGPPELQSFYRHVLDRLYRLEAPPSPIKPGDKKELTDLLQGLHAFFEPRKSEISKRLLSVRLYGDSKRWEALEKSLVDILKKFCLTEEEASSSHDEILAERGIVDNPVHINLAGPLVFSTSNGKVDLSLFYPDLGLSSEMAKDLNVEECNAKAVVTIENKASFYQYIKEKASGELVLYLGGYHNTPRRELLKKIYRYVLEKKYQVPFYHWGDMDLGGITIWYHLINKTGIPFQPLYMDVETYRQHLHRGHPLDNSYCQKLALLWENPDFKIFHPLIEEIIKNQKRVEQEAIILEA